LKLAKDTDMRKTIIVLAGFSVPIFIAKSKLVWDDKYWDDYIKFYFASATPRNDKDIESELIRLETFINSFSYPIVVGHSLGAWWAANLIVRNNTDIKKTIYYTPLGALNSYSWLFKASQKYNFINYKPPETNYGKNRHLVVYGNRDLITPEYHAHSIADHFGAINFRIDGGHFYQPSHKRMLGLIKNWIEK
jgi:pimeloyl-ACP methyl ester carboxylesterase